MLKEGSVIEGGQLVCLRSKGTEWRRPVHMRKLVLTMVFAIILQDSILL